LFFVSHKRDGDEVGRNLRQQLCTVLAEVTPEPLVETELPLDFFDDEYTFFFSFAFVEFAMTKQFSGKDWPSTKKFEFREAAFNRVDQTGNLHRQFVTRAKTAVGWATIDEDKTKRSNLQNIAIDDAWTMVGVLYGFIRQDDSHILVKSTKKIVDAYAVKNQKDTTRSRHSLLIAHQTIGRRMKERYVK
tara:strand:- start:465 stop:1031 length:567 start_codon:yes stop_codon:yes gene_type:complete